jgi:hypothetical protein
MPDIITMIRIKKDEMGRTCSIHGRKEIHIFFVGKYEGKRQLGRPRGSMEG